MQLQGLRWESNLRARDFSSVLRHIYIKSVVFRTLWLVNSRRIFPPFLSLLKVFIYCDIKHLGSCGTFENLKNTGLRLVFFFVTLFRCCCCCFYTLYIVSTFRQITWISSSCSSISLLLAFKCSSFFSELRLVSWMLTFKERKTLMALVLLKRKLRDSWLKQDLNSHLQEHLSVCRSTSWAVESLGMVFLFNYPI